MTRTHAAHRLLALGPLRFGQIKEITGWPKSTVSYVLNRLEAQNKVRRMTERGTHWIVYGLA
jgi:DNA-binding transcriptional regulator GbsR (MarR family)